MNYQKQLLAQQKDKTKRMTLEHTLDIIGKYGIDGVTTKRISNQMNMSTGILHHHFGTKENIIYETYLYFVEDIHRSALTTLKKDSDAYSCLSEFGRMHFSSVQTSTVAVNIWLSFWHGSINDERIANLLRIYNARFISNVAYLFRQIYDNQTQAKDAAKHYFVLIQGLWMGLTVTKTLTNREQAIALLDSELQHIISNHKRG